MRVGVVAASVLLVGTAYSHAVINETKAIAGSFSFITLRITHGCGTSPTNEIRMKIPDGVSRVSPRFESGWAIEKRMKTLDTPRQDEAGNPVTETVDEVVWSGGSLPDGLYGEFQIRAMMPDEPGRTLRFKTVQVCNEGRISWSEVPTREGQSPYEFESPSPFIKLVAREEGADDS